MLKFDESHKLLNKDKKLLHYSMSTNDKFFRLYLELLTSVVGIVPLMLLYIAAQGGFSNALYGFRQANGIELQIWQYLLLVMSTICILAALSVFHNIKDTYLRWRVAHSFTINELDAHLSQSLGPSRLKMSPIAWAIAILITGLCGAITALHNTAFTIHQGRFATNTFARAAVSPKSGGLRLDSALQFGRNCSSISIGNPARQVNTCPYAYSIEGMLEYLASSQVVNDTGMSEYGGMVFSDQHAVPAIMEIMNGTFNATATYSNADLFDYSVDCVIEPVQTFDQNVIQAQAGRGNNGIPTIYYVESNDTVSNQFIFYSVAAWDLDNVVGIVSFSRGNGTGKVVFPTTATVGTKLNRTVCSVIYKQQQGDVYIDFSRRNASVMAATTVMPNAGQLEIADYTIASLQHLTMVASQLYLSPFQRLLGNDTTGNFSVEFLAMQIRSLLRKGHYLINAGFGTIKPIEGILTVNVNQFNDIKLITLVLFIQILVHMIGIIIALCSFYTPIIAAEVYAASTWWSFGAHASDKPVDGCTGIMSKEQLNRKFALREIRPGYLQMTVPTEGTAPSEKCKYAG